MRRTPAAMRGATLPESLKGDLQLEQSVLHRNRLAAERALDEALAESFPASDPPSWTLGIVRPNPVPREPHNGVPHGTTAHAPPSASGAVGVAEAPRPRDRERTFGDALISLAAASGLVLLVPVVILLIGLPIALFVRGLVEAFGWLLAFVIP